MPVELQSPLRITSRWHYVQGRTPLEVFTYEGVDYIVGAPADIVVTRTNGQRVSLCRFDPDARAAVLCPRHKSYKAMRRPRGNCPTCLQAYEARQ
jgi:hypothetical protein